MWIGELYRHQYFNEKAIILICIDTELKLTIFKEREEK